MIFVPGLMGSELWRGSERIFPNIKTLFTNPEVLQYPLPARAAQDRGRGGDRPQPDQAGPVQPPGRLPGGRAGLPARGGFLRVRLRLAPGCAHLGPPARRADRKPAAQPAAGDHRSQPGHHGQPLLYRAPGRQRARGAGDPDGRTAPRRGESSDQPAHRSRGAALRHHGRAPAPGVV